jgi:hypothetical protein
VLLPYSRRPYLSRETRDSSGLLGALQRRLLFPEVARYPNISAIENDRRVVGLAMAKKLGEALSVDYRKFIEA